MVPVLTQRRLVLPTMVIQAMNGTHGTSLLTHTSKISVGMIVNVGTLSSTTNQVPGLFGTLPSCLIQIRLSKVGHHVLWFNQLLTANGMLLPVFGGYLLNLDLKSDLQRVTVSCFFILQQSFTTFPLLDVVK